MSSKYLKKWMKTAPRNIFGTKKKSARGFMLVEDRFGKKERRRPYKRGPISRDKNVKGRTLFSKVGEDLLQKKQHPQQWRSKYRWLGRIGSICWYEP